ncbi:MAG: peroxidase family protein, partial [Planctomycetota bacterium]
AGGHTLGKGHGAAPPKDNVGPEPEGAGLEEQGFGWKNSHGTGKGADTITSGLEGAWTSTPTQWSNGYFDNLFGFEWELTESPAGAKLWTPKDGPANVPDAHDPLKYNKPVMFTTDLSLRFDPEYAKISKRFHENPEEFNKAFARAWYKLTHRDMGPVSRCLGPDVPPAQLWQDPIPAADHALINEQDIEMLKGRILESGFTHSQLVSAAWASASTFRNSDKRGGANGARVRLAPQNGWEVNNPAELGNIISRMQRLQAGFNQRQTGTKRVSLADLIVLGGCAAIEDAAAKGGYTVHVPFTPGRMDATEEMTDAESFAALEPTADGFRNYFSDRAYARAEKMLLDKANLLGLTAPEMTVLVGGMRVLDTNFGGTKHGVFTDRPGTLTNDFFVNLLSMSNEWKKSAQGDHVYEARDRESGEVKWTGTSVDLVFGSNSQLRALAEVYGSQDAGRMFAEDFAAAWSKVMNADRFEMN